MLATFPRLLADDFAGQTQGHKPAGKESPESGPVNPCRNAPKARGRQGNTWQQTGRVIRAGNSELYNTPAPDSRYRGTSAARPTPLTYGQAIAQRPQQMEQDAITSNRACKQSRTQAIKHGVTPPGCRTAKKESPNLAKIA